MPNLRSSGQQVKAGGLSEAARTAHLLTELIKRDFRARFTGSALGVAWAVLQPLSLVALYWFVFTVMIPRSPAAGEPDYVLFLISGLLPWLGFNEGIMRGTTSVVENAAVVRRLPLRSEILVVVPNASAMIFQLVALAIFLVFLLSRGHSAAWLWMLFPALLLQLLLQTGISWMLSALYVFFRDVTQIVGFALSFAFYLSPILYQVSAPYAEFFRWNPLTPLLALYRSALVGQPLPDAASVGYLLLFTAACFLGGLRFFRRTQPALPDLI